MKNKNYVKQKDSDTEMYKEVSFQEEKSLSAREEKNKRKKPTSVALDEGTINRLKELAEEKGIPYQVLMRSYILKGLKEENQ
jgi:predicted DNA binding CopG/RHH family protein